VVWCRSKSDYNALKAEWPLRNPESLTERQRLILCNTDYEVKQRAVRSIQCKLCPAAELNSWQCFQRYCKTSEDNPAELTFCD
jgi:hypothetical protein